MGLCNTLFQPLRTEFSISSESILCYTRHMNEHQDSIIHRWYKSIVMSVNDNLTPNK